MQHVQALLCNTFLFYSFSHSFLNPREKEGGASERQKSGNNRLLSQDKFEFVYVKYVQRSFPFTLHYANSVFIPNITGLRERHTGRVMKLRLADIKRNKGLFKLL